MADFLRSKIAVAAAVAIAIVGIAIALKVKNAAAPSDFQKKVGLIADASVAEAIKNGAPTNLDSIETTSATDTINAIVPAEPEPSTPENLTATDRFSRDFFQKYVALKGSGAPIDENTGTDLVNQLLAQDYGSSITEKSYTQADIKVLNTTSLDALKKYGNSLGAILQEPLPQGYEQELSIFARVTDTGNDADLSKLSLNISHYQSLRDKILALPVPAALKEAHLALINSLEAIIEGLQGMMTIKTDPVGATKLISRYEDGIQSISLPIEIIRNYLKRQSVAFSSYDSGYILTQ